MNGHETATTHVPAEQGFRAVQGGGARRSGTVLLVEAYSALWVILLLFVWKTNQRQRRLEQRIGQIEASLKENHE